VVGVGAEDCGGEGDQLGKVLALEFLDTYYLQLELAMSRLAQLETDQKDLIPPRQIVLRVDLVLLDLWVLAPFRYVCVRSLVFFESFQLLSLLGGVYGAVSLHLLVHQGGLG
jgi:hypothetical protein